MSIGHLYRRNRLVLRHFSSRAVGIDPADMMNSVVRAGPVGFVDTMDSNLAHGSGERLFKSCFKERSVLGFAGWSAARSFRFRPAQELGRYAKRAERTRLPRDPAMEARSKQNDADRSDHRRHASSWRARWLYS
jgi:hypothetical protein